jgi:glycosyltransferase involved in cell wall biosynthesis
MPLRLLHLHNRYQTHNPSGETTRVLQEAKLLKDAGHDVRLMVIDNDQIPSWSWLKRARLPARTVWSASSYRFVSEAIGEFAPDVIHIHNTFPLASPSIFWSAHKSGIPVVHTLANYRLMCPAATFIRDGHPCEDCLGRAISWPAVVHRCYRESTPASATVATMLALHGAMKSWHRTVDLFLVGSEFARRKHIQGGIPPRKIATKPNTAPDPGRQPEHPREHYVYVGRLGPEKNVELLLHAWARARMGTDRQLTILGSGPERQRLELLARDLRIKAIFLGSVSRTDVTIHLLGARAIISPSVAYEVSPISIVEAFAAGAPAVVPSGGAQAEIVSSGETGMHFTSGNVEELCACLERLEHDRVAVRLGQNARKAYEERHSAKAVTSRLEWAYALVGSHARDEIEPPPQAVEPA